MFYITRNYYLIFDDKSVNLATNTGKVDKNGKPIMVSFAYYSNIGQALEGIYKILVKEKVHNKDVRQLEDLRKIIIETQQEMKEICKKLKI